jgi:hypothetical protein
VTTLAVVLSFAFAGHPAKVDRPKLRCRTRACHERVARKACSNQTPIPCIRRAALRYRVSFQMLKRKAWCESRFDPGASNGSHVGVFQFAWATWATTRYADHSPWFAKWNALAAAELHAEGRGNEWECS